MCLPRCFAAWVFPSRFAVLQASVPLGVMIGYMFGAAAIWWEGHGGQCGPFACWRFAFLAQAVLLVPLCILMSLAPAIHVNVPQVLDPDAIGNDGDLVGQEDTRHAREGVQSSSMAVDTMPPSQRHKSPTLSMNCTVHVTKGHGSWAQSGTWWDKRSRHGLPHSPQTSPSRRPGGRSGMSHMSRTPPLSPPLRPHLSSVATTDPATGSPRRRASTGSSLQDEALERAPTPLLISVQAVSGQDGNGNITDSQYATEDMNGSLPLVVSAGSYLCTGLQQIRFVFSKPGFTLIVLALSSLFFVVTGIQFWATDFLITALDGGKYVGRVRTGWSRLCLSVACLLPVCACVRVGNCHPYPPLWLACPRASFHPSDHQTARRAWCNDRGRGAK